MKLKRPNQRFDLVEVIWDDAANLSHGWTNKVELPAPQLAISVGFLISDGDYVVLAQDIDGDGNHNGRGQIPRGMVKKIRVLRKKDPNGASSAD